MKPSWTIRRRYVFVAFSLGVSMVIADISMRFMGIHDGSTELLNGGVAVVTLVLGTYVFGAAYENKTKENTDG